ncbi:MAG: hypothetical protein Q7J57_04790 [Gemmobacter sp.]|nr:hypothetical protein [Gemmobacter sp.]
MSIWTSRAALRAGLLACLSGLAACMPGQEATQTAPNGAVVALMSGPPAALTHQDPIPAAAAAQTDGKTTTRPDGPPPTRMALAQGKVIVAGPKGFCIDRAASIERTMTTSLVVLSSCAALGAGLFAPRPDVPAMLTAAIAPTPGPDAIDRAGPQLTGYFTSEKGRAALSRSGDPTSLVVIDSFEAADAFVLHLRDRAPFPGGSVQPEYWRAILTTGGRMVTVSAYSVADRPLAPDIGRALLMEFVSSLRLATAKGL